MRKFLKAVVVVFAMILAPLVAAAEGRWAYRYPIERDSGFSISKRAEKLKIGSLMLDVKFCSKADRYICFESEGMSFSVPRDLSTKDTASWSHGNHRYDAALMRAPLKILGTNVKIYQIDSPTQDPRMRFFYSKERGLVGAKVLNSDEKVLLLLEQACGFGASHACAAK